jgi:hypothetical protein
MNGWIIGLLIYLAINCFFALLNAFREVDGDTAKFTGALIGITIRFVTYIFLLYMGGALK